MHSHARLVCGFNTILSIGCFDNNPLCFCCVVITTTYHTNNNKCVTVADLLSH